MGNAVVETERPQDGTSRVLRKVCLSWELLRIVYNLVMLGAGLSALWFLRNMSGDYIEFGRDAVNNPVVAVGYALIFGVAANILYCFGPLAEWYLYLLRGRPLGRGRYLLFAVGLLLSLAFLAHRTVGIHNWFFPGP